MTSLMTSMEVARMLRVDRTVVYRLARDMGGFRVGTQWRFPPEGVEEYIRIQQGKTRTPRHELFTIDHTCQSPSEKTANGQSGGVSMASNVKSVVSPPNVKPRNTNGRYTESFSTVFNQ